MSVALNECKIIGNLGADPEMQFTPNGVPTTKFNVAVSRTFVAGPEKQQKKETEWFRVVTWNKLAESCNQHLHKGSRIFANGRIHLNQYTDQAGQNHAKLELIADRVLFLDRKIEPTAEQPESEETPDET